MADEDRDTPVPEIDSADWEALARYLAGTSDPAERSRLERELASDPARAAFVRAMRDVLHPDASVVVTAPEVEAALRSVLARRDRRGIVLPFQRPRRGMALRAAAVIIAAAGALVWWRAVTSRAPGAERQLATGPAAAGQIVTGIGEVDSVRLADGTRAVLGPRSTLTIPADYGTRSRALELRGEGYFDVRHDPSRPFIVRTAAGALADVGTQFAVQSSDSAELRVAVLDGVVAVQPAHAGRADTLRAHDRGVLSANGVLLVERGTAGPEDVAWMGRRIVLRDASVAVVGAELARWYGLDLRVADSTLRDRRITATFERASRDDVAHLLAAILGGSARLSGDTLWIASGVDARLRP